MHKLILPRFLTIAYLVFTFSAVLSISACGNKAPEADAQSVQEVKVKDAQTKALVAEIHREKAENEKKETEKQLQKVSEVAKSNERTSWILVIVAVISLLVGIAIGSSSRKDAISKKQDLG